MWMPSSTSGCFFVVVSSGGAFLSASRCFLGSMMDAGVATSRRPGVEGDVITSLTREVTFRFVFSDNSRIRLEGPMFGDPLGVSRY